MESEINMSQFDFLDGNNVTLKENSSTVKEGFIEVIGGKAWFKILGCEKESLPLLILHGGPGSTHESFEPFEELKSERPIIFYDQLGCGNSDRPQDKSLWTVERFVEEVSQVINALGLNILHIFGNSWGSMLAIAYILKYNKKVVSCSLSGPFLSSPMFIEDAQYYVSQLPKKYRDVILRCEELGDFDNIEYQEAVNYFYHEHLRRLDTLPDCVLRGKEKFGAEVYNHMWGPSEFTATGTLKDFSLVDRLHEINIPVLLTVGRYDEVRPQTVEFYKSKIPNAEMIIIEDASHCTHNEKPEELLRIIKDFLSKVENK